MICKGSIPDPSENRFERGTEQGNHVMIENIRGMLVYGVLGDAMSRGKNHTECSIETAHH